MKAHELLSGPEKWTRGTGARKAGGMPTRCRDDDATCWCVLGAITRCYDNAGSQCEAAHKIVERVGMISTWNDAPERTYDAVHSLLVELDV